MYPKRTATEEMILEAEAKSKWGGIGNAMPVSDFGLLQRIHPGHALVYLRTDRDEAGERIGRVLGWEDGRMVAIREDGAAVEVKRGG